MEEDIKTLEELLKASKENDMYEGNKYFKSLEYFIKEYQDLKEIEESHRKENGKLRERVKELEEWNEYYRKEMLSKEYIKLNYIPKSKVEEKIEELNKQLEEDLQDEIKVNSNRFIIICQCKSCLQELLEKR